VGFFKDLFAEMYGLCTQKTGSASRASSTAWTRPSSASVCLCSRGRCFEKTRPGSG
jgi:hypothetical protein